MVDVRGYLAEKQQLVDSALAERLPPENRYPEKIHQAMRYSVLAGGKRIRPILVLAACEAVGGDLHAALPTACAIEFIHTFSLIHDDLPALDNDDLRRGKPTSHKVFGEAIAILAGDALLAYAFEIIAASKEVPAEVLLEVVRRIASAAGIGGVIAGEVVDLESEGKEIMPETLKFMHAKKTGALIEASVIAGGLLGGGTPEQIGTLGVYGANAGIAFQIADDILNVEGTPDKLGKSTGTDAAQRKSTYPAAFGLEESKRLAREFVETAIEALEPFGEQADVLRALARLMVERES